MSTAAEVEYRTAASIARGGPGAQYSVAISYDPRAAIEALRQAGGRNVASPFQHPIWLASWFATAGREPSAMPFIATVHDERRGQPALLLPLVLLNQGGRRVIEFADLGVTDCNAPLLGLAPPRGAETARRLWNALKHGLPTADAIRLSKMPGMIGARPNPLALLPFCLPSNLSGNLLNVPPHTDVKRARGRFRRKEIARSHRVFERLGGTEFRRITDVASALGYLRHIEEQQRRRIHSLGLPYALDAPNIAAFYRTLIIDGLDCGYTVLTVMLAGEEVVAALLGVRQADTFATIRISNAGGAWKTCSPGRLILSRTIDHLAEDGCTSFDFSIGDYEFKRRLGGERVPLFEITEALSWRGLLLAGQATARGHLRRHPGLVRRLRRLLRGEPGAPMLMMASR